MLTAYGTTRCGFLHRTSFSGHGEAVIGVLIIDDHRLFAEAIRVTLDRSGVSDVAIVTNAEDGLAAARELKPELVLLDIGLPDRSGLALGKQILDELPHTKIVVLTALEDENTVREALSLGFRGYLTKQSDPGQFRRTITSVLDGQVVFPHRARRASTSRGGGSDVDLMTQQLTAREIEVLQLLTEGASSARIAERLRVSPNTVRTHVQGILSKLQVHSRLEAAAFAVRHGLVSVRS